MVSSLRIQIVQCIGVVGAGIDPEERQRRYRYEEKGSRWSGRHGKEPPTYSSTVYVVGPVAV